MIRVDDVSKSYGSLKVLEHFSLEIPSGQTTVLIGPSGCGKTTLMEMMNGLISPDSGTIYVGGKDIASEDPVNLRRRIGYVIQEVGLFPHYTVYENIALIPRLLKWEESRIRKRVEELIHLVHIPVDRLDKYPHQLSGGQQQRIGVARALAADP
ncbi:MAG: ATP-binding cassette domain-containing protein, partial [Methanobacteriota archaeon]